MITYAEALRLLLSEAKPIEETETIPLMYSTGRVLAEDIASPIDVPGWDNSQMDGYALRVEDIASASQDAPGRLPVAERIAAGKIGGPLQPGTCARIFTGAALPPGADTVVPQEDVSREGDVVAFSQTPQIGAWVRRQGSDVAAGSVILHVGDRLTPGAIGMDWPSICDGIPEAARRRFLFRRRTRAARRTASSGRHLQLQPFHGAQHPAASGLRGDGPWQRAGQSGGHQARIRARCGNVGRDSHDGRHVGGRRRSH